MYDPFDSRPIAAPEHVVLWSMKPPRPRYWLHLLLLLLTVATTTIVGSRLHYNFLHDLPIFGSGIGPEADAFPVRWVWRHPHELVHGLPFSLCLLVFFLAHESGHYVYCLKHRINATLPFFLPFPSLIGTLGAVIRIRSPFHSRRALFNVGVAGPIAGMCVALPMTVAGLVLSKPMVPSAVDQDVVFGTPLTVTGLYHLMPGLHLPATLAQIQPHPVLLAAWVGLFATALNLIPGGQLDGGHILYGVRPTGHRRATRLVALMLLLLGIFAWVGWVLWGALLLTPLFRHPDVPEEPGLTRRQRGTAALAFLLLVLTFQPAPFQHESAVEVVTGKSAMDLYHHWQQTHRGRPKG
jgi:Zn-dependent protease